MFYARFTRTIDAATGTILGKRGSAFRYNAGYQLKFTTAERRDAWVQLMKDRFGDCVEAI